MLKQWMELLLIKREMLIVIGLLQALTGNALHLALLEGEKLQHNFEHNDELPLYSPSHPMRIHDKQWRVAGAVAIAWEKPQ